MKLTNIADYVTEKISSEDISLENYITTDNLLPDKQGRTIASNLPPQKCTLTKYAKGDVLIANIRPYLKKIWMADGEGGASNDVLVFRAKDGYDNSFVYAVLLQDSFYSWVMKAPRGSQMPRGDKNHIMNFNVSDVPGKENIGKLLSNLDRKIALNRQINTNLEALARQLYDYWFVQFDFPDANGNPYKSSGGKMVYNEKLKREIPDGWEVKNIFDAVDVLYGFPFNADLFTTGTTTIPVIRIRDILEGNISTYTTECVNEKYRLHEKDVVIGMDGNFHMGIWHNNDAYLNQRCVRLRANEKTEISAIQILYTTQPYIKYREKTIIGSTVGHLSDKDMKALYILVPVGNKYFAPRKTMDSITQQIIENKKQITSLTRQRDELLPLLMNGQVIVRE